MKATVDEDKMQFFDPSDSLTDRSRLGKAFHLTIDYDSFKTARDKEHCLIRDAAVNQSLQDMTWEVIYGYIPSKTTFDTYAFAVCAVHRYRDNGLEQLQPNFTFRPLEVIKKTLENTTQLAKAIVNAPRTHHLASRFKWLSRFHLRETICTDTIFARTQDVSGQTCAQVY